MKLLISLIGICLFSALHANEPTFTYFKLNTHYKNFESGPMDKLETSLGEDFEKACQEEAKKKVSEILSMDYLFELGAKNQIGFDFSFSLGFIKVKVERKLYPNLANGGWSVDDTIGIKINGSEYLEKLASEKIVTITSDNLKLFASVYYKRVYKYQHHAATYKQALLSDYRYLTHSYKQFINSNYTQILPGELVSKNDSIGIGLSATVPIATPYFIEIINNASVGFINLGEVIFQKPSDENDNRMFVTYIRSSTKNTSIDMSVGNDLINLVYFTLINLNYSHTTIKEITRVFELGKEEIEAIDNDENISFEINDLIKFKGISDNLTSKYQKSQEEANLIQEKGRQLFLMWGRSGLSEIQHFDLDNFGSEHKYFTREVKSSTSFSRSPTSLITFGNNKIKFDAFKNQELKIEFATDENKRPILITPANDEQASNLFAKASTNIQIKKSARYNSKKYQKLMLKLLKNFQGDNLGIADNIESKNLTFPFEVLFDTYLTQAGLIYLLGLGLEFEGEISQLCKIKNIKKMKAKERSCFNELKDALTSLYQDYQKNNKKTDPTFIKNLFMALANHVQGPDDYQIIFGAKGIFRSGYFRSKTKQGDSFQIYFKDDGIAPAGLIEPYFYKY